MKTLLMALLISTSAYAEMDLKPVLPMEKAQERLPVYVTVIQKDPVPSWAWFAMGALTATATWGFFYYKKAGK